MTAHPFLLSHSLAAAAESNPDGPAIVAGDDSLTYAELVDRAGRFAAALRTHGITRGDRVLVHASKSVDTVVAIHGTQWAGAVAVPVDPAAPASMLAGVARDASPRAIVTDTRSAAAGGDLGIPLRVGQPTASESGGLGPTEIAAFDPVTPADVLSDDPAYILYTSGSTGVPKGIVHSHRSGLRYAQLAAATYGLTAEDRLANIAPFHFDQSTFELYAGPVGGSTTVLVPQPLLSFPAEVSRLVADRAITVWYSVPTLLVQLLERGALERFDLSALRWVLFGGEVFPPEALAELMSHLPNARFSNVYGPTEVNQCTHHHLDGPPAPGESVPIGRPWGDTDVRLVDTSGELVEGIGRGTLEVRSSTMMLGYWGRPDLTDEATTVEHDAHGIASRWYRSGDVVDRDERGLLHFVGRVDRQVKVRGHRIELEGVESVLSDSPGVVRSAVVVVERSGDQVLVGVIEGEDAEGAGIDTTTVLDHVRRALPPYAVPTELMVLPALPRTGTGKVDAGAAQALAARTFEMAGT